MVREVSYTSLLYFTCIVTSVISHLLCSLLTYLHPVSKLQMCGAVHSSLHLRDLVLLIKHRDNDYLMAKNCLTPDFFQCIESFWPYHGSGAFSASNRNEYQKIFGGKAWSVCKADNLTAMYEPSV
jgi:hypothetical protein